MTIALPSLTDHRIIHLAYTNAEVDAYNDNVLLSLKSSDIIVTVTATEKF